MIKVSQSKINTWRRCKFAYHCRYVDKLRKRTKSRPLTFGGLVHDMIEAHANGDDPFDRLQQKVLEAKKMRMFDAEWDIYMEVVGDVQTIMAEYFTKYKKDDLKYVRVQGKNAEHSFEVEIYGGILAVGKIDAFAKAKKLKWIVEHKTFGRKMPTEDDRWRNLQSSVYIRMAEMLGLPRVDGMAWDYIYSKPPTKPAILVKGGLSRAKITTLPSVVRQVIKDNGLQEKDYVELIKLTEETRDTYFQRVYSPVDRQVVNMIFHEFVESAIEIAEGHGFKKGKTIGLHCAWCDYEGLCRAELQGLDVDFVKEREYIVAPEETIEVVAVEE